MKQERRVVVKDGQISKWEATVGEIWASGYDERAGDDVAQMNLEDGEYVVTFIPVGENRGMDSIKKLTVTRV